MQIDPDVLNVLRAATVDGPALRLNGQLDRKLDGLGYGTPHDGRDHSYA
ncbi:hypothetical protein [Streptomyces sp. NPDC005486]